MTESANTKFINNGQSRTETFCTDLFGDLVREDTWGVRGNRQNALHREKVSK